MSNNVFKQDLLNIIAGLSFLFIINILTDVKEDFTPNQFGIFIRENDIVRNLVYIIVIFITIQLLVLVLLKILLLTEFLQHLLFIFSYFYFQNKHYISVLLNLFYF